MLNNSLQNNPVNDPLSVRWSQRFTETFEKKWNNIPPFFQNFLIVCAVFLFGISINGDCVNLWVHMCKQLGYYKSNYSNNDVSIEWSLKYFKLQNYWSFFIGANIVSFAIYFGIGGFLHWNYYVRQRDCPEKWKCQPKKFMSPELERHEIFFGSTTLFVNGTISSLLSCYISNGGYSTVYYNFFDYGWWWFFLQIPVIFIYEDYMTYWMHRIFHTPFLYLNFHKMHHKYKQPTAFSVTAIHPIESLSIQLLGVMPLFLFPVHWLAFYMVTLYIYYHGIITHSGVTFKSYWWQPWQPDAIFHDNHHQYFHVNYGFNIKYWDKLHGTYRRKDRIYSESTFYGKGKSIKEASKEEIEVDVNERNCENPLAYRDNKLEFQLDKSDIENITCRKTSKD